MNELGVASKHNNTIQYFIDGENIYPQIIKLIESAKKSIFVEVFLFYDDASGRGMVDKLVEKAQAGLDVRVLLSEKGMEFNKSYEIIDKLRKNNVKVVPTFPLPKLIKSIWDFFEWKKTNGENKDEDIYECSLNDPISKKTGTKSQKILNKVFKQCDKNKTLKEGGFLLNWKRKRIYRSLQYYDHRKIILVDNQRAFMGGMNFGNDYLFQGPPSELGYFHDIGILIEGDVIKDTVKFYLQIWHLFSTEETTLMELPQNDFLLNETGIEIKTIYSFPNKIPNDIRQAYLKEIILAQKYIYIINLYLTDNELLEQLIAAAQRGVDVHIISTYYPGKWIESQFTRLLYRGYFYLITCKAKLQDYGIKLHHYTKYNVHAKVGIIDDRWVTIGSSNLDYSSLRNALEVNISLYNSAFIQNLKNDLFFKDFTESNALDKKLSFLKKIFYYLSYKIFMLGEKYFL